ncbi:hypothetical protein [Cellvibrio sp. UBA7671]|uniref:hypothetical protein n=1 Tax=Cellvibrio sp. UBA7671 TaxID=1946312 RepID=UPI002F3549F2
MSDDGLIKCQAAFLRLKTNKDLDRRKITASFVSSEAGFDRGYLKKSRSHHLLLIGQIEAFKKSNVKAVDSVKVKYRRAISRIESLEKELEECKETMYKVLTQNLQLVETVHRLERLIKPTSASQIDLY